MIYRLCAWCRSSLDGNEPPAGANISHGICPECCDLVFGNDAERYSLQKLLERLDVPVLAVNGERVVLAANQRLLSMVGRTAEELGTLRGGDVMNCTYARLPEGCGHTVHCDGCTIRNTVLDPYRTGVAYERVEAYQDLETGAGVQRMRVLVTTEKVGDTVLVRIDGMEPAVGVACG